jgi:hypothetical protein
MNLIMDYECNFKINNKLETTLYDLMLKRRETN